MPALEEKPMTARRTFIFTVICIILCWIAPGKAQVQQQKAPARLYNTAKQKLRDGKQIVGATVFSPDPNIYCAMANSGYDFLWIEMQHSPLTFEDVARMIWACRGAPAMPFIRVPDATESDIQKATDIGALGIIVPTVDTVEKAQAAVKWSKYPPEGRRSQGGGQYSALWGSDYRQTINAGMRLGGPLAWKARPGFTFLQGPGETALIRSGAQVSLGTAPAPGARARQ